MDFQVIVLLLFRLAMVAGPTTSYSATGNKMFTKLHQVNQTLVYYQHKLVVHRVIQIPCYLESPNLSISPRDSVSYEWLMNGRQIRKHTPFVYGTWDVDGVLTILAIMIRRTTIWCHARAEFAVGPLDFYFAHQIQFYEEPVYQTVISVLMMFPMPKDALERKCKYEKHTCDCRTEHGPNATEIFDLGLKTHFVKDTLQDLALDTCNQENTCLAVSLDDFQCINDQPNNRSVHHTTFSFFLYPGRSYSHLKAWKPFNDTYDRKTLFKKFQMKATEKCQNLKKYLESQYYLLDTSCKITVQVAHFEFCMGAAGRLENDVKECRKCLSVSFTCSYCVCKWFSHSLAKVSFLIVCRNGKLDL
ncbi:hypothetical protein FGIG_09241 [Fasciola gigantica]|uniref:Uncharacterized protein n=1 Tax=Fasciola gigantica TaxID=46835 RepID=A0A504WW59_FASGI|nr:hypothetical protein FGIG_09241 [Fasciola gigantica]